MAEFVSFDNPFEPERCFAATCYAADKLPASVAPADTSDVVAVRNIVARIVAGDFEDPSEALQGG
jgi:hypothetical protein